MNKNCKLCDSTTSFNAFRVLHLGYAIIIDIPSKQTISNKYQLYKLNFTNSSVKPREESVYIVLVVVDFMIDLSPITQNYSIPELIALDYI